MSLSPDEIEGIIALKVGEIFNGQAFRIRKPLKTEDGEEEDSGGSCLDDRIKVVREIDAEWRHSEEEASKKRKSKSWKCRNCGNEDDLFFEKDPKEAQITCTKCGTVLMESMIHDGEWVRQFEGEVNPSLHGAPPDDRMSGAHNMRTGITDLPGMRKSAKDLGQTQKKIEMNFSNYRKQTDNQNVHKATRQGYKDNEKEKMFTVIDEVGNSLQLHGVIISRAKTLFARVREKRESLHDKYAFVAACMILAFRERETAEMVSVTPSAASSSSTAKFKTLEFKCKHCNYSFSSKRDVKLHVDSCEDNPLVKSKAGEHETKKMRYR